MYVATPRQVNLDPLHDSLASDGESNIKKKVAEDLRQSEYELLRTKHQEAVDGHATQLRELGPVVPTDLDRRRRREERW